HEFVIQRAHRFSYDQSFRVPGGVLVEIGLGRRTMPFELENAIGLATAGGIYLVSPLPRPPGVLSFQEGRRIAPARRAPVPRGGGACQCWWMSPPWFRPGRTSSATSATAPTW